MQLHRRQSGIIGQYLPKDERRRRLLGRKVERIDQLLVDLGLRIGSTAVQVSQHLPQHISRHQPIHNKRKECGVVKDHRFQHIEHPGQQPSLHGIPLGVLQNVAHVHPDAAIEFADSHDVLPNVGQVAPILSEGSGVGTSSTILPSSAVGEVACRRREANQTTNAVPDENNRPPEIQILPRVRIDLLSPKVEGVLDGVPRPPLLRRRFGTAALTEQIEGMDLISLSREGLDGFAPVDRGTSKAVHEDYGRGVGAARPGLLGEGHLAKDVVSSKFPV
mmetsp:Transcript_8799/g.20742  ORF Transcript_8799/g.20742 Transcript_8799/m.20742 type:complete len:276 (-) Transcript_8799:338-1165(-)